MLTGEWARRFKERMENPQFSQKHADILAEAKRKVKRLG